MSGREIDQSPPYREEIKRERKPTFITFMFSWQGKRQNFVFFFDRKSLYNLVNKTNLVHYLFLVYLSISTCFGRLCAHHHAQHMLLHTRKPPTQNNKYQVSHKHSCFSWWWAHSRPKHVEIDKCSCIPESRPHRITSTKCRINTPVSPDDRHIDDRNT